MVSSQYLDKLRVENRAIGCMYVVEALLPYGIATKLFLPIFDLEKMFHTSKY
jgi:hypothetical protein